MTEVSVSTVVFDGHPVEAAFETLAALGLRRVEPAYIQGYMDFDETAFADDAARLLRQQLFAAGLAAPAISAHIDLGRAGAPERLGRRLRFAAAIGAECLITNAAAQRDRHAMLRCLESGLREAEAAHVTIALENPGHGHDVLVPDGAAGAALLSGIASPRLRMNYDCANVLTYSEGRTTPEDDIWAGGGSIGHFHFKDAKRTPDGWVYVPLGEGDVALEPVAECAVRSGAPVGVELPLRLSRKCGGDPERRKPPLDLADIKTAISASVRRVEQWLRAAAESQSAGDG